MISIFGHACILLALGLSLLGILAPVLYARSPREALFTGQQPYSDFEHQYYSNLLGGNSLASWLKALI